MHENHFFPKKSIIYNCLVEPDVGDKAVSIPSSNCSVQESEQGILSDWRGKMTL
jgi:hypothetical protein